MKRCLALARNGLGATYPNPMVGSVIVHQAKIIGEGWHQKAGAAHAEVNAIHSVKGDKSILKESTLYVNLEPCSHHGKTPPCADLIIQHQIKKVVIGTADPFAAVAGSGISRLKKAGIEVVVGVLEQECNALNKRFFKFHQQKRPYIILKWAQTQNGMLAPLTKDKNRPVWISNEYSRQLVHKWRTEEQGILVGTQTALQDNPKLDARHWAGQNPVRIILDRTGVIPPDFSVYDKSCKTIFITETPLSSGGDMLVFEQIDFSKNRNKQILDILYKHQLQSVIIEGGKAVLESFIQDNLWDEARVFSSDAFIEQGIKAPGFNFQSSDETRILNDSLKYYYNPQL
ncbi:MAG TPA: bifunctional diaminohydroxyphosphoribosylaminopyrimidine deaminase/5-amino-6-(5-phosphoribosylamino)uracil reductase RibD [Flavobacterium sp.]|nr:bifunctional diaminohydroxyphosphoribosylaminopyrimidine deaminase/5-amino-6-(5-phosphoribosylamino)uracil reductase RibD [Flavobacterium sp.]